MDAAESAASALFEADLDQLLPAGVRLRNEGHEGPAEVLLRVANLPPHDHGQPGYELGLLLEKSSRRAEAIAAYRASLQTSKPDSRSLERLLASLALDGRFDEISNEVDRHQELLSSERLRIMLEFCTFVQRYPLRWVESEYAAFLGRNGGGTEIWNERRDLSEIVPQVTQAITKERGFALLRIGDGAGTWLPTDARHEAEFASLYGRNRDEFWRIWFGDLPDDLRGEFAREMAWLSNNFREADVLGIPPLSWMRHEYEIGSVRGVSALVNAFRHALRIESSATTYTGHTIHFNLGENESALHEILNGRKRVGIISCHPALAELVKDKFNVSEVVYLPVPGEPSRRHLLGEDAVYGQHFPDRFFELRDEIVSQDFSGVPVLVAGGVLGRSYSVHLKNSGAVALDIGSVADKWLGKKTRPGF